MTSSVCLVVFPYDCHASGGIRNAAVGLVRTLVHAGCPVDVASPRSGNPFEGKTAELGGAKVRAFHYYERGCRDMAEHIAPDVDFIFLWWCTGDSARFAEAAKKRGIPYLWYSGGVFQCRSLLRYLGKFAWFNFSPFMRNAAAVVVPTETELRQAHAIAPLSRRKIVRIPHEIPGIDFLQNSAIRNAVEKSQNRPLTFGFLGRLDVDTKGLDILVAAFCSANSTGAKLSIAGPDWHGGKSMLLRRVPKSLLDQNAIEFVGPVYGAEKEKWFQAIDVYIQISRHEGFGITIAEAMQREKPVLLSRKCNIVEEVVSAGAGFGCVPTVPSVKKSLEKVFETSAEELRRMGECGRRWVAQNCAIERVSENTMKMLGSVSGRKR